MDKQVKKYTLPEEETMMANEPLVAYNATVSPLDALWTLVLEQAEDVQRSLELRLRHLLLQKDNLPMPYTAEELHKRVTLSEEQFAKGLCLSHAEVQDNVDKLFESWS